MSEEKAAEFIELNEALDRLEKLDERKALVVTLRYFGGLGIKEIAENLRVASSTVSKDWEFAKAWLRAEMSHEK
jgi:RNA polymerase sigma factor (sigma-70 family)